MGITRLELWRSLGIEVEVVRPLIVESYEREAEREWRGEDRSADSPHGSPWATCLAAETEVVTRQGIKPIRDLAEMGSAELLIPSVGGGASHFVRCDVREFSAARLYRISLRKSKQIKTVYATANHRWFKTKLRPSGDVRETFEVTTADLQGGDRLRSIAAPSMRWAGHEEVRFAVAQGFVFGDGARRDVGRSCYLDVFHNGKHTDLLPYFVGHQMVPNHADRDVVSTQVRNLPSRWKDLPSFDENRSFLLSWVAGYFAADGCVGTQGQAILSSAFREHLEFVRDVLALCGIGYGKIVENRQSGFYPHGAAYEERTLYHLKLRVVDLPDWFFVRQKHRERVIAHVERRERFERYWKVEAVEETDRIEPVYCAVVPEVHAFALADNLLTGNSFHASSFPGSDPVACGRAAFYTLMDLPSERPREPFLSAWFELGTALEHTWVRRLHARGRLLSKSPAVGDDYQTVFVDHEHWLSGAADAIVLPPGWTRGHNVEVKTTSEDKVAAMKANPDDVPYSHAKYVRQLKTYIALAYEQRFAPDVVVCEESWAITREFPMGMRYCPVHESFDCATRELSLEPPTDGTLIYSSRERPLDSVAYLIEYDPEEIAAGRRKLAEWRVYFERGLLPPHPLEGQRAKWSVPPCRFCQYKGGKEGGCKLDYTSKVARMADSTWVPIASSIRPDYDYAASRAAVLRRWGVEDPLLTEAFA